MNIYNKYINKQLAYNVVAGMIILLNIGWITQIVKLLYLIDYGVNIIEFFYLISFVIPFLLYTLLPFINSIAIISFFTKLEMNFNIMILKANSMSNWQIIKPVLIIPVISTILAYYISFDLMPRSYIHLRSKLHSLKNNFNQDILQPKKFIKISKKFTLYIDSKTPEGELNDIIIFYNKEKFSEMIFSKKAKIKIQNNILSLSLTDGKREITEHKNTKTKHISFSNMLININTGDKFSNKKPQNLNSYSVSELFNISNKDNLNKGFLSEGVNRIIWPLYNILLPFLAISIFMALPTRKKSHIYKGFAAISGIIIASFIHFSIQNFASSEIGLMLIPFYAFLIMLISAHLAR